MEKMRGLFICVALATALLIPVISAAVFDDQKNFFTYHPDPHVWGTPPAPGTGSNPSPSHGSGDNNHGSSGSIPSPSHGSGGNNHGSSGSKPSPSHGSGGNNHGSSSSPSNCGSPPSGGHHHNPSPSPPKGSGSGSSGSYHNPPTTPSTPSTPSIPSGHISSPPFDPHSPFTGTCDFWRSHPGFVWSLSGSWGTIGGTFGLHGGSGSHMTLLEALSNTREDGFGALYREGTASLLNSMANKKFPYSTSQVRDSFIAALSSNKAAEAQSQLFKLANEGKLTPKY